MKQIPIADELVQGAVSLRRRDGWVQPWRLPEDQERLFPPDDGVALKAAQASGVRLRFRTDTPRLGVCISLVEGGHTFDLTRDNEIVASVRIEEGEDTAWLDVPAAGPAVYELWLPQDNFVRLRHLLVEDAAELAPAADDRPRWVTYGSSISQCTAAHSPARIWPAVAARATDLHVTAMGFGGECHLEPMVARTIRDLPADLITIKAPVNIYGAASLSPRTLRPALIGFVQIVRERHPDIPIGILSAVCYPHGEVTENAVGFTLPAMRAELADAVDRLRDAGDTNLHFFDGLEVFGPDLAQKHMPDGLHPDGDGYEILGRNFTEVVLRRLLPGGRSE